MSTNSIRNDLQFYSIASFKNLSKNIQLCADYLHNVPYQGSSQLHKFSIYIKNKKNSFIADEHINATVEKKIGSPAKQGNMLLTNETVTNFQQEISCVQFALRYRLQGPYIISTVVSKSIHTNYE